MLANSQNFASCEAACICNIIRVCKFVFHALVMRKTFTILFIENMRTSEILQQCRGFSHKFRSKKGKCVVPCGSVMELGCQLSLRRLSLSVMWH